MGPCYYLNVHKLWLYLCNSSSNSLMISCILSCMLLSNLCLFLHLICQWINHPTTICSSCPKHYFSYSSQLFAKNSWTLKGLKTIQKNGPFSHLTVPSQVYVIADSRLLNCSGYVSDRTDVMRCELYLIYVSSVLEKKCSTQYKHNTSKYL